MSVLDERDVTHRRWTRAEYDRMVEVGVLTEDDRVELVDGAILTMSPQNSPHATAIGLANEALRERVCRARARSSAAAALPRCDVRAEPDLAVVEGGFGTTSTTIRHRRCWSSRLQTPRSGSRAGRAACMREPAFASTGSSISSTDASRSIAALWHAVRHATAGPTRTSTGTVQARPSRRLPLLRRRSPWRCCFPEAL